MEGGSTTHQNWFHGLIFNKTMTKLMIFKWFIQRGREEAVVVSGMMMDLLGCVHLQITALTQRVGLTQWTAFISL